MRIKSGIECQSNIQQSKQYGADLQDTLLGIMLFSSTYFLLSFLAFSFLALRPALCQADPSFYIAFEFNSESAIEPFSEEYRQIRLPCVSRILSCTYDFSLLPPGWKGQPDSILLPLQDALTTANYAVQLTASEITGESLSLSLVLEISQGRTVVRDKDYFFGANGFNTTAPVAEPKGEEEAAKGLSEFPSLSSIAEIITSGDFFKIGAIVSQVVNKKADCQGKVVFLDEFLSLLYAQIAKVEGRIKVSATEAEIRTAQIREITASLQKADIEPDSQERSRLIQQKINQMSQTRTATFFNYNRYNIISNSYLKRIKEAVQEGSQGSEEGSQGAEEELQEEISLKQKELEAADSKMKELVSQKMDLELRIAITRLKDVVDEAKVDLLLVEQLEREFREYSELAIQEKVKFQNIEYEIGALTRTLNAKSNSLFSLDSEIGKIEEKIEDLSESGEAERLEELSNLNQILKNNVINMENKISTLQNQCGRFF